jgi:SAM-dependent MidA family methyltransferase
MAIAHEIGLRLAHNGGAALIIDYGHESHSSYTLRVRLGLSICYELLNLFDERFIVSVSCFFLL